MLYFYDLSRFYRPNVLQTKPYSYLTINYPPMRLQAAQGIQRPTSNLTPFCLTKAEKFQLVNLTPVEPIEFSRTCHVMYPSTPLPEFVQLFAFPVLLQVVEWLGDRLGNCIEDVLDVVRLSLTVLKLSSWPPTVVGAER